MANVNKDLNQVFNLEEFSGQDFYKGANKFVNYCAATRNSFKPVHENDLSWLNEVARAGVNEVLTSPEKIVEIILQMNKKADCIKGDIPMKIISGFA